jgi:hypothetical protein
MGRWVDGWMGGWEKVCWRERGCKQKRKEEGICSQGKRGCPFSGWRYTRRNDSLENENEIENETAAV